MFLEYGQFTWMKKTYIIGKLQLESFTNPRCGNQLSHEIKHNMRQIITNLGKQS